MVHWILYNIVQETPNFIQVRAKRYFKNNSELVTCDCSPFKCRLNSKSICWLNFIQFCFLYIIPVQTEISKLILDWWHVTRAPIYCSDSIYMTLWFTYFQKVFFNKSGLLTPIPRIQISFGRLIIICIILRYFRTNVGKWNTPNEEILIFFYLKFCICHSQKIFHYKLEHWRVVIPSIKYKLFL